MRQCAILFCVLFLSMLSGLTCQSSEPGEKMALSDEMLKPRQIAFEVCDVDDPLRGWFIPVHQIWYDGKPVSKAGTFQPGKKYDLTFQLKARKTVRQEVEIPPGEGPFRAAVPIYPLKEYRISVWEGMLLLDSTISHCEFYAEDKKIEEHLIRKWNELTYGIWADTNAGKLYVYFGYFFAQVSLGKSRSIEVWPNSIHIGRLIEHLENQRQDRHAVALEIMEKMVQKYKTRVMLEKTGISELESLTRYVERWKDVAQPERVKALLDSLNDLKNSQQKKEISPASDQKGITVQKSITGDFTYSYSQDKNLCAEVLLNGRYIRNTIFQPGKYQLEINAPGYFPIQEDIVIAPTEKPFLIERVLVSKPRPIVVKISFCTALPPSSMPPEITLAPSDKPESTRVVKQGDFVKPGSYILRIEKEGYKAIQKKEEIWPSEFPVEIHHCLYPVDTLFKAHIVYDVEPPTDPEPPKIFLLHQNWRNETWRWSPYFNEVKDGSKIKPGSYFLSVEKSGYTSGPADKIEILPGQEIFAITRKLFAIPPEKLAQDKEKEVSLKITMIYDVQPDKDADPCEICLLNKNDYVPQFVKDGSKVKPGSYFLAFENPGYQSEPIQEIEILPGEKIHQIQKKWVAKPRPMSDHVDPVMTHQILYLGKPLWYDDTFQPGQKYDMVIRFKKCKTIRRRVEVKPGEGATWLGVSYLEYLRNYRFNTPNTMTIDDTTYDYEFYVDGEKIEEHLIDSIKCRDRIYYTIMVNQDAKNLQVYAGYYVVQNSFAQLTRDIGVLANIEMGRLTLDNIDTGRLLSHLEKQSQAKGGHAKALEILESMLQKPDVSDMLKKTGKEGLNQLMQYLQSWKDIPEEAQNRVKTVLEKLQNLGKQ